jgi:hypothetical protein
MGDEVEDERTLPHLYVTDSGHCFNVEEDLLPNFQRNYYKNPYTGVTFEPEELQDMLTYPYMSAENRTTLRQVLKSDLSPDELRVIRQYPDVFILIYRTGYDCFIDYTDMYEYPPGNVFFYALEALGRLNETLDGLPTEDRQVFISMKVGRTTLADILAGISNTCIHAGGIDLLKLFMHHYHLTPENARPNIEGLGIVQLATGPPHVIENTYLLCFNTRNSIFKGDLTMIYIYDQPGSGRSDFIHHFGRLYPQTWELNYSVEAPIHDSITNPWIKSTVVAAKDLFNMNIGPIARIISRLPQLNYTRPPKSS